MANVKNDREQAVRDAMKDQDKVRDDKHAADEKKTTAVLPIRYGHRDDKNNVTETSYAPGDAIDVSLFKESELQQLRDSGAVGTKEEADAATGVLINARIVEADATGVPLSAGQIATMMKAENATAEKIAIANTQARAEVRAAAAPAVQTEPFRK